MKKEPLIVFISILFLLVSCRVKDENIESAIFSPVNYVDPYIGTGGHGHTFLGVAAPFGAVQIGPNNINKGWDWCSGYHYSDSIVIGFSHLHLNGTGCSREPKIITYRVMLLIILRVMKRLYPDIME